MKKGLWRRTGACIALLAILATCLTAGTVAEPVVEWQAAPIVPVGEPIEGSVVVADNDKASLRLDTNSHMFYLENKQTGYVWSSAPADMDELGIDKTVVQPMMLSLLKVDYVDIQSAKDQKGSVSTNEAYSHSEAVQKGSVTYESIDNGFQVTYFFKDLNLIVPMQITLNGDCLNARVNTAAVQYDPSKLAVVQMHILPHMGAVSNTNEQGYAMVPDGCGAVVYATTSKETVQEIYQRPVYGKDMTIADTDYDGITMPCFGLSQGQDALLAVIDADAEDAYINCEGNGYLASRYAHAWASFKTTAFFMYSLIEGNTRNQTPVFEEGGIKAPVLSVSYYMLGSKDKANAGYAEMAAKYRELLFTEEQLNSAKTEAALYIDLYASVTKIRSILGFKSEYEEIITSTEDVAKIINKLAGKGVDSTVVRYNAWNKQENEGNAPTEVSWNSGVGDVAAMVKSLAAKNCTVYPSISRVMTYGYSANPFHTLSGITRDPASRVIMDTEPYLTTSETGEFYVLNYTKLSKHLSTLLNNMSAKANNVALSDITNTLYSDFSEGDVKRPAFVAMIKKALADYTAKNSLMVDSPNAYAAAYADEIINLPASSSGNIMLDEDVPFLQLVYSGVVRYSCEALNLQGSPDAAFLKALEYGAMPCYAWIGGNPSALINTELDYLFSSDYNYWIDKRDVAGQYAAVKNLVAKTEGTAMVAHEQLADGVFKSTYGNNAYIVVNYNGTEFTTDDGVVVGAMSYVIGG